MTNGTDRLLEKRWGVFNHFLYGEPGGTLAEEQKGTDWNARVNAVNVEKIASQLHEMGAGYYFITLMQGRQYMLAPNQTYDTIAGAAPGELCAERDLVMELSDALSRYDIDLCLYYTGDGPYKDAAVGGKFGFIEPRGQVSVDFVSRWASVLREYSVRYGDRVTAWWVDGCYDYFGYDDALLGLYYEAVKAGNPAAVAALNNGVKQDLYKWYVGAELTPGEYNDFTVIPEGRWVDGAQVQILAPLGLSADGNLGGWGRPGAKRDHAYMKEYIRKVNEKGGIVTVDIAIGPDGSFDPQQMKVLTGV